MNNVHAKKLLDETAGLITSDRSKAYGPYLDECRRSANVVREWTGLDILPQHIPLVLLAVKMARQSHLHKHDNMVDGVGYLALYCQMLEEMGITDGMKVNEGVPPDGKHASM